MPHCFSAVQNCFVAVLYAEQAVEAVVDNSAVEAVVDNPAVEAVVDNPVVEMPVCRPFDLETVDVADCHSSAVRKWDRKPCHRELVNDIFYKCS